MCKWHCTSEGPSTNLECLHCRKHYCGACLHGEAGKMKSLIKCAGCGKPPRHAAKKKRWDGGVYESKIAKPVQSEINTTFEGTESFMKKHLSPQPSISSGYYEGVQYKVLRVSRLHLRSVTSGLGKDAGLYGIAMSSMGMLCTAVYVLAMNNFGPIADNAGGIIEMARCNSNTRAITDNLDAAGNVTKAQSKGYAVGGSALSCFVLFNAFLDEINIYSETDFNIVNLAKIENMIGGLMGLVLIFVFTGWCIRAATNTAQEVVYEVRKQFKQNPSILTWDTKPNYHQCVKIVAKAALIEMIKPALLALVVPVCVGVLFRIIGYFNDDPYLGVEVLCSFLVFAMLAGLVIAIFCDNSGGSWDNAKKLLEAQGERGDIHAAAVTGDTVGDPLKDTAGPALHVIMTTMATTVLIFVPLFLPSK